MRRLFSFLLFSLAIPALKAQDCSNWLSTPTQPSYMAVGKINITGNQITVEAKFNRTTPYSGGLLYAGDLVTKHNTPSDCNYLLRPNDAEITTSNGYFRTPDICEIQLNKTYHVAMTYDGSILKFYRDGFLMSQIAATGNLYQNNWLTRIGWYEPQGFNTNFIGYIDEVRIWNVVKSQAQIQAYMNSSLPSPTTQAGLVAYYTFDDLLNKQGNSTYNGVLGGGASINATNSNCDYALDSCNMVTPVTITSFETSVYNNRAIKLDWHTEEENNIESYIIERSQNGFEKVGEIVSKKSYSSNNYSFIDKNINANTNYYYRLQIVEKSGKSKYSETRIARVNSKSSVHLYPNPSAESVTINTTGLKGIATLTLINTLGQNVLNSKIQIDNNVPVQLNIRNQPKGQYYLVIQTSTDKLTRKITKL